MQHQTKEGEVGRIKGSLPDLDVSSSCCFVDDSFILIVLPQDLINSSCLLCDKKYNNNFQF